MRLMVMTAAAIAISGGGGAAFADPGQTRSDAKKPATEKKICVTEQFAGSLIPSRICKTKAEWDAARGNTQYWLDKNNGKLFNDQLVKGEGGGMHISTSTPGGRPQ